MALSGFFTQFAAIRFSKKVDGLFFNDLQTRHPEARFVLMGR